MVTDWVRNGGRMAPRFGRRTAPNPLRENRHSPEVVFWPIPTDCDDARGRRPAVRERGSVPARTQEARRMLPVSYPPTAGTLPAQTAPLPRKHGAPRARVFVTDPSTMLVTAKSTWRFPGRQEPGIAIRLSLQQPPTKGVARRVREVALNAFVGDSTVQASGGALFGSRFLGADDRRRQGAKKGAGGRRSARRCFRTCSLNLCRQRESDRAGDESNVDNSTDHGRSGGQPHGLCVPSGNVLGR